MTKRLTVLGVLTTLVLSSLALTAPAATAVWRNAMQLHGGKVQACKVPLRDGRIRIKARLDNRGADHTHLGGLSRIRDGRQLAGVDFRTAAGRVSPVKTLVIRRGDWLSAGMGEVTGEGAGGDFPLSHLRRC